MLESVTKKLNSLSKKSQINLTKLLLIINQQISDYFRIKINLYYEIIWLTKQESLNFNIKYRKRHYVADVISVPLWQDQTLVTPLLGEIYLCFAQIKKQAKKYEVSFLSELARMLIHGILHLLEFDHEIDATWEYITMEIQDKIHEMVLKHYQDDNN